MAPASSPHPSPRERGSDGDAPPVRPEIAILLLGLALLLVFLALEPYLSYALFGSDSGEYYTLTAALMSTGSIPHGAAYGGWGSAYPDFPGIYLLAGASGGALGLDAFSALTVVIPVVAVLSVFPLFLLFRRLYPHDSVALLAAALGSVAMPRLFSIAHPAPLALGDFLAVAALWMFLESRRDVRWYFPLALTGGALIITHHLSTYFFVIGALGGLLLLELWHPGLWSKRFPTRELVFLGGFVTATFAFWFYGTYSFVAKVLLPGLAQSAWVGFGGLEAALVAALLVSGFLIHLRRRHYAARRSWVRLPTDRSLLRDAGILAVVVFVGIAALLVFPLPGTTQRTQPEAILWFVPVLGLGVLCAGSRRLLTTSRLGLFALTWAGVLGLSAMVALLASGLGPSFQGFTAAIPASRHVEYILIPVGLVAAVGAARLVSRLDRSVGRRAALAGALGIVVIVAANAAIVYPPRRSSEGSRKG